MSANRLHLTRHGKSRLVSLEVSNEHVFERLCFFIQHDWWLREDNVKFWLVLD